VSGTVFITGAAGFIGSHLAQSLLARGERVAGFDNFDPFYPEWMKRRNLEEVAAGAGRAQFDFIAGDVRDADALAQALRRTRPESVVHLAARAGVRPSIADPAGYASVNIVGTSVLLRCAHEAGCRRVIVASSSSVYGNAAKVPFSESDDVSAPVSPYAATKLACEHITHAHRHLTGMPSACLRFFTVVGPAQRPDLAASLFLHKVSRGEPVHMFGDGSSVRDYTFVGDIVAGILAALDRVDAAGWRVWNLGGDAPVRLRDLVAAVGRVVGREPRIEHAPSQPGDVERTWADLTRARAELEYAPTVSLEEALSRQWAWMRTMERPLRTS
jgi:UDP-glucuronate 4-epimerase